MVRIVERENNYAFRLDQIAWISLKQGDPLSIKEIEKKPRVNIVLMGNNTNNIITCESYEIAKNLYNEIVTAMKEL